MQTPHRKVLSPTVARMREHATSAHSVSGGNRNQDLLAERRQRSCMDGGFSFGTPAAFGSAATPPAFGSVSAATAKGGEVPKETAMMFQHTKLESPWREVQWTEDHRDALRESVSSYRPSSKEASSARVLLLGPVGSGKSSFIGSLQSVFSGRVINHAMVGTASGSFTKKLQSFPIRGQGGEESTGLVLCDVMGLGEGETSGLTLPDALSVVKGHAPDGHKFIPEQPVTSESAGYVKKPSVQDKVHCVVFVLNASKVLCHSKGLASTFQKLREHIGDLGVHQVAVLTHVDEVCQDTAKDVSQVYNSRVIQQTMSKAGAVLGMCTSYIVPVKNYSSELEVDINTDILLLRAADHILQYANLHFQDHTVTQPKTTYTDDIA